MTKTQEKIMRVLKNKTANTLTTALCLTNAFHKMAGDTCDNMRKTFKETSPQEEIDLYSKLVETTIQCITETYAEKRA
jgi:hypothetical protein